MHVMQMLLTHDKAIVGDQVEVQHCMLAKQMSESCHCCTSSLTALCCVRGEVDLEQEEQPWMNPAQGFLVSAMCVLLI